MNNKHTFSYQKFFLFSFILLINDFLMPFSVSDSDSGMVIFLFLMPLLTILTCFIYGCTRHSTPLILLISMLLFFLSATLFFSAGIINFTLLYGILSSVGYLSGCYIRKKADSEDTRRPAMNLSSKKR